MTSKVKIAEHEWSEDALFCKALLYNQQMDSCTANDWRFGFWSALSLEFLARAALAHISPVLLASSRDWRNLAYALGKHPTTKNFSPTSVGIREVLDRLHKLIPDCFNEEIFNFCIKHMERRNSELHSGKLAFQSLGTSGWLSKFYMVCKALLESMEKKLEDLVSDPEQALDMIESLNDDTAKAVKGDIKAYKQVWLKKDESERNNLSVQAEIWAIRKSGHRVECPSCDSKALLRGSPGGAVTTEPDEDNIIQRQTQIPSSFECIACGLRISGFSKLSACGLGDAFSEQSVFSAAEFFNLYTEDDLEEAREQSSLFEEDFND